MATPAPVTRDPASHHLHFRHVSIDGTGTTSYATASQYEHAVLGQLRRIYQSHTGRAVFHEFGMRSNKRLKIVPHENDFNAITAAKNLQRATAKGALERYGEDGRLWLPEGRPVAGKRGGSDSKIEFTPLTFTKFCNQQKAGHIVGAQPDEVLFHEMVHATRQMRGLFDPIPLGHLYDTEEEFFAILLTNIYASETGRLVDLRSDHYGFEHLTTDVDTRFLPNRDMTDYRYRLVSKLVHSEWRLSHELRQLHHTPFNPIRRYFELQRTKHLHASLTQRRGPMDSGRLFTILTLAGLLQACTPSAADQPNPCGIDPKDWCRAPPGDPCGRHTDTASCRADTACYGMPYQGESLVACKVDKRGFSSNCPTVGCTSTPPRPASK